MTIRTSFTLRYRARRAEIWRYYWRAWRSRLWIYWLAIPVGALTIFGLSLWGRPLETRDLWLAAGMAAATLLFFVLYPQLRFKPEERVLTADSIGIRSTIGKRSGARTWQEFSEIRDTGETIALVVAKTTNAFVIPNRAFADALERADFLESARAWHAAAGSDPVAQFA